MSSSIDPVTHRIDGSRTTVYHVLDYLCANWTPEQITKYLPINVEQVAVAAKFIED
jgi:uncharacterized protein (DUF433 family)